MGNGGSRSGIGDEDGGDTGTRQNPGCLGDKALAKEARVAAYKDTVGLRLAFDVSGNAGDS
jgi:hypothetical protein